MARQHPHAFWASISACEHIVQIFDTDESFVDALVEFTASPLMRGEAAVVVVTKDHLRELERRLSILGINLPALTSDDRMISIDAEEALSQLLVNDRFDKHAFTRLAQLTVTRAGRSGRKFRVAGEMVGLLAAGGHFDLAIDLERLWARLGKSGSFPLFCGYPRSAFAADPDSISRVWAEHSAIFAP